MNFGITPITATTTSINKTVTAAALTTSVTTPFAFDRDRAETVSISTTPAELRSSYNSTSNRNTQNILINPAKSFTTPQNCLEILTSLQNNIVPGDCDTSKNYGSTVSTKTSVLVIPTSPSQTNAKLQLGAFGGIQSTNREICAINMDGNEENIDVINNCLHFERTYILPEDLPTRSNSFLSETGSNIDYTTESNLCSTSNSISSTSKNSNSITEAHLNQPSESDTVQTEETSCCNIVDNTELNDNINEQSPDESKTPINSINTIHCDEDSLNKSNDISGDFLRSIYSSDCVDKIKSVSRLSERAKKKSWYNVLYPNYKSRSQDFRKLFKEVPNEERLIVDYSCALYRDLLIQGRLYISQNYVCFHANILGWETCLIIKWKDVTSITKEKTALVIPNAISICTPSEKYFFSSFTTRDKTFLILFRVWQNTLMNKPMPAQEVWQLVHNYYGDELGLTTDDEDYIDPSADDRNDSGSNLDFISAIDDSSSLSIYQEALERSNTSIYPPIEISSGSSASSTSIANNTADCVNIKTMKTTAKEITLISAKLDDGLLSNSQTQQTAATSAGNSSASSSAILKEAKQNATTFDSKRKVSKNHRQRDENTNKNSENLPTDISDSSDSEENNIPFVATAECNSPHEGRQLVHTILPINIDSLFNILFSKSKFLVDFHVMRKSTDLVFGEWITNEDGQKTRTFNVTVQLAASVGPKTSKVTEFQVMRDCSKPGELYSIDVNNVNSGIPYADSFSVLVHYCLVKTVDDHTMLSVHSQIKYKKSVWGVVKGFIEKNTWAGLDDFYTSLLHSLQSETCIPPAKGKGRRPRRGTAAQIRPSEEMPILQTNTEPAELCGIAQAIATRHPINSPVKATEATTKFRWLSLFVLVLLCFLIIVNVILLLKLWKLEERIEEDLSTRARMPKLSALKQLPNNHEDWIELLRQQELLHETELKKWHTVLQTAIELLKKVSVVCQSIFQNDKELTEKIDQISDEL